MCDFPRVISPAADLVLAFSFLCGWDLPFLEDGVSFAMVVKCLLLVVYRIVYCVLLSPGVNCFLCN